MVSGLAILRRSILIVVAIGVAPLASLARADRAPATVPVAPPPPQYVCARAAEAPSLDGKLDDPVWETAVWTSDFVDIITGGKVRLATRAKLLWDDSNLYIAAELREPHLRAKIDKRDEWVFHENAFEIFIDPDGDNQDYAEIQINALGTLCDVRMDKPYRDGGKPDMFWDVQGMRSAVHLDGTLNDVSDEDKGWTIEISIPWHALAEMRRGREGAPKEGEQ